MRKFLLMLVLVVMAVSQLHAQNRTLTGRITNESGNGLEGATVSVVGGSGSSVTTNPTGNFTISVSASARQLEVSYVGYTSQRISIGTSNSVSASLATAAGTLEDAVVTGYGRVKRSTYSGAAARIDKKAIELVPVGSFDQILQGRTPGLLVTAGSGQPGASARVQLRGATSIAGGSTPLYIVDGVPVEAGVFQSLNPNDFESVDVLKDAQAQSLYGSRGAAGVIVVTTKRGKSGRTILTYRGQVGTSQPGTQQFEMMNTSDLLLFQEKLGMKVNNNLPGWALSRLNPTYATASTTEKADRDRRLDSIRGIDVNWKDVFFRIGTFNSHDLNISGGSDKTRFFLSGGVYNEQGIAERSDLKRATFRFNLDHTTDKLTMAISTNIGYNTRNFIESEGAVALANPFASAYLAVPYQKVYNDNGTISTGPGRVGPNSLSRIFDRDVKSNQMKATLSGNINYNITNHIYAGGQAGLDFRETNNITATKPGTFTASVSAFPVGPQTPGGNAGGAYGENLGRYLQFQTRAFLGYRNIFAAKHSVDVSVNTEYIEEKTKNFGYTSFGLNPKLPIGASNFTPGTVPNQLIPTIGGGDTKEILLSYFALGKYTYNEKYTLDLTVRRDGYSILPPKNRYQTFYAVGANWNVMKENFAANLKNINTLRLRASYGNSANAKNFPLGQGGYYTTYAAGNYAGLPTLVVANAGNPDANWEYTNQLNIGIDFGFFKDRVTGTLDVYNKITENLYISQVLSAGAALAPQQVNAGSLGNKGIELGLNYDIVRNANLTWSVGGSVAYNKNEILDLGQVNEFETGTSIIRKGLPIGSHYLVKWGGVDAATGRPLYYDKTGKLTDVYSAANSVADFGTFNAPYIGGFNTSIRFKGIDISAFFTFQEGFSRFNNQDFFQLNHAFATQGFNLRKEMLTIWNNPGDVTDIQSPLFQREFSSKDIQDASYVRFRNLTASYTVPRSVLGNQKYISNIRIYGQAQNLFTWTNWSGFDPEDSNNIASYEYPLPRIYTLGLDISF